LLDEYERLLALQRRHYREVANLSAVVCLMESKDDAGLPSPYTVVDVEYEQTAVGNGFSGNGQEATRSVVRRSLPAIRRVLDAHDLPQGGPVRPLSSLDGDVKSLVRMRLQSNYTRLATQLPLILPALHRALHDAVGQRRSAVAQLLAQAYRSADAVADKFGYYDLSARIISLMSDVARESGDELSIAAASYVRAEMFFADGQFEVGRAMLERAADRLMPEASEGAAAAYGSLHMRAAVLAARGGAVGRARDHLLEASSWAHGLSEGVYTGTVFGPASVRIHEVALAVDSGDPAEAVAVAKRWQPPADLPAERRSHFYIDLSRGMMMLGAYDRALQCLLTARAIAPEHVRDHPYVHDALQALMSSRLGSDRRVHDFQVWAGVSSNIE
jgi:hypothetical protein